MVRIKKVRNKLDVTRFGAFESGSSIGFRLCVPRALGVLSPVMLIHRDGWEDSVFPCEFSGTDYENDEYSVTINPVKLLGDDTGLLFYTFAFDTGDGRRYLVTYNNLDAEVSTTDDARFSLLIYEKGFDTPAWLKNAVMYHVFVDRFAKGEGNVEQNDAAVIDPDWENGIPQYAEYVGAPLKNNVFFGGNLWGVAEKLDYLSELGVNVIYLSPIFEARSNHKYDTGDYLKIDPGFGGEPAFRNLIEKAAEKGIRIILDGVFNHTGDDSRYFDVYDRTGKGAFRHEDSEYRKWFSFRDDGSYECWWNIEILPRLNHGNPDCRHFFTGKDGVAEKYLKSGISGWRLDVADELNDDFLFEFTERVKSVSGGNAAVIGEVWENAAVKSSYGKRRPYLRGKQLDSVMNYPFRNAVKSLLLDRDADAFYYILTGIYSSYPRCVSDSLMNIIGTHDTERILTVLGGDDGDGLSNAELSTKRMSPELRDHAKKLLKIAAALQYTVYGFPSVYYGDEAGLEGYHDPFCRLPFPWGREDRELLGFYRKLGAIRNSHACYDGGEFEFLYHGNGAVVFRREKDCDETLTVACVGEPLAFDTGKRWRSALDGRIYDGTVTLAPNSADILERI